LLDIAVPEPVLDEAQIGARLEQMGGDGVLEAVEVPLGRRQLGGLTVLLHEPIQRASRDRIAPVAGEQHRRRRLLPLAQPGSQCLDLVRLQRMRPGVAAPESMHHQAQRAQVEVVCAQQAHLAGAESVAVGKQEHCAVTHALPV
jgi:hypothetical protein